MGGCASRPKDLDIGPDPAPVEAPSSPVKAEPETTTPENTNNGGEAEKDKEAPLVDVSEAKPEVEAKTGAPAAVEAEKTEEKEVTEEKKVDEATADDAKSPKAINGLADKKESQ